MMIVIKIFDYHKRFTSLLNIDLFLFLGDRLVEINGRRMDGYSKQDVSTFRNIACFFLLFLFFVHINSCDIRESKILPCSSDQRSRMHSNTCTGKSPFSYYINYHNYANRLNRDHTNMLKQLSFLILSTVVENFRISVMENSIILESTISYIKDA